MTKILIEEAKIKQEQEPVGKVNELFDESVIEQCGFDRELLVYTSPPPQHLADDIEWEEDSLPAQRKPLTYKEIVAIDDEIMKSPRGYCVKFTLANELRRLHEENQEMLEALKAIIEDIDSEHGTGYEYAKARAVVDKGEQK